MKNISKHILSCILIMSMIMNYFPVTLSAATTGTIISAGKTGDKVEYEVAVYAYLVSILPFPN